MVLFELTVPIIYVGQVSANANIDSAVIPAWRSAKTQVSILLDTVVFSQSNMTDSARLSPSQVGMIRRPPRMSKSCKRILLR